MASVQVLSKHQLRCFFANLRATASGVTHASWGSIELEKTYRRNIRDPPRDIVLPGFAESAFRLSPVNALAAFKQFCSSQLGQHQTFSFWFLDAPNPPPLGVVLANFNGIAYGPDYLNLTKDSIMQGADSPKDVDADGWAFGVVGGRAGWYPPTYVRWM